MSGQLMATCAREPGNELISGECKSLTGGTPDARGVAACDTIDHVEQAAYLRYGVMLLAQAPTLDQLVDGISRTSFEADAFRVDVDRLPDSTGVSRREAVIRIADALAGARPNLDAPRHRFHVTANDAGFQFGEVLATSTRSYRQHDAKPYRTSSSLPCRLSRAVVNLVAREAKSMLDPCCGTGSLVMEAIAVGLAASGSDWNPRMVGMSRGNLAHFGYDASVDLADARESVVRADAVVTNLPYGRNLRMDVDATRDILHRMAEAAPVGVYVAAEDMTEWLLCAGYGEVEIFRVPKSSGFVRLVHYARHGPSPSLS